MNFDQVSSHLGQRLRFQGIDRAGDNGILMAKRTRVTMVPEISDAMIEKWSLRGVIKQKLPRIHVEKLRNWILAFFMSDWKCFSPSGLKFNIFISCLWRSLFLCLLERTSTWPYLAIPMNLVHLGVSNNKKWESFGEMKFIWYLVGRSKGNDLVACNGYKSAAKTLWANIKVARRLPRELNQRYLTKNDFVQGPTVKGKERRISAGKVWNVNMPQKRSQITPRVGAW